MSGELAESSRIVLPGGRGVSLTSTLTRPPGRGLDRTCRLAVSLLYQVLRRLRADGQLDEVDGSGSDEPDGDGETDGDVDGDVDGDEVDEPDGHGGSAAWRFCAATETWPRAVCTADADVVPGLAGMGARAPPRLARAAPRAVVCGRQA